MHHDLLSAAAVGQANLYDVAEEGVYLIALYRSVSAVVGSMTPLATEAVDRIVQLCRRFPKFVNELKHRYSQRPTIEVNDEYDVHDLLRSLLWIDFRDVRHEEPNPSLGGRSSRSDIFLKAEGIVIELKIVSKEGQDQKIIDELIKDKAQYRTHPDYHILVCFVYDPKELLANPVAIENDLSETGGKLPTRVVVSPRG